MKTLLLVYSLLFSGPADHHAEVDVRNATIRVTIRQPVDEDKARQLVDWVASSAHNVSLAYGRVPVRSPHVIVVPTRSWWRDGDAVQFGRTMRHDGGTIELFVNAERPIDEFYDDWTATHEFSHLMLPLLDRRDRWISEGFATYYQNLLMTRAGHYSAQRAWQRLTEGFERGRRSRPDLSPREAADARARMKYYWSGAALALLADVSLRRRSDGTESLDLALAGLHECCLPSRRRWSGTELFETLDAQLDAPVFMPLYGRYAEQAGFPDVDATLSRLGIVVSRGQVRLDDDAPLALIRSSLTQ